MKTPTPAQPADQETDVKILAWFHKKACTQKHHNVRDAGPDEGGRTERATTLDIWRRCEWVTVVHLLENIARFSQQLVCLVEISLNLGG